MDDRQRHTVLQNLNGLTGLAHSLEQAQAGGFELGNRNLIHISIIDTYCDYSQYDMPEGGDSREALTATHAP